MAKILFVLDETLFFHPTYFENCVRELQKDHDLYLAAVTEVPEKCNLQKYFQKNPGFLKPLEIFKLGIMFVGLKLLNLLYPLSGRPLSVRNVAREYKIPFIEVQNNINQPIYLDQFKTWGPDLIVSSNSLYFGKTILNLPRLGCINRHSALLPKYGGVWPVFYAVKNHEKEIGVTVHWMQAKIDSGASISQKKISFSKEDTVYQLYRKCFEVSVPATVEAVRLVLGGLKPGPSAPAEYHSFPTAQDWKEFRNGSVEFV